MTERKASRKRPLVEVPTCLFRQRAYRSSYIAQKVRRRQHR